MLINTLIEFKVYHFNQFKMKLTSSSGSLRLFSICIVTFLIFHFQESISQNIKKNNPDNYVVLLSIDGFRWDYPTMYKTPNLNKIAQEGVKADALIPCYPSKTFPNHYSIATGLYPDNHGIVMNSFYDKQYGYFSLGDRAAVGNGNFYLGEPIWVTAEKQGVRTASFYWVGSEAPIQNIHPTYWKKYKQRVPFTDRLDTVLHWLTLPDAQRPRLITWYYHEPDWTSHEYGPKSIQTKVVVEQIDSLLGVYMAKMKTLPIYDKINFIIVSDHGMATISSDKFINLSNYVKKEWFDIIAGSNPDYILQPKEEYRQIAYNELKKIPNLKVWLRDSIPARFHYGKNPRVCDILIECDLGYSLSWADDNEGYTGGAHGYDNQYPDMHGIFYAIGPAFKKGYTQPAFMNINVYPLITHLLNIKPAKVDGNLDEIKGILK